MCPKGAPVVNLLFIVVVVGFAGGRKHGNTTRRQHNQGPLHAISVEA